MLVWLSLAVPIILLVFGCLAIVLCHRGGLTFRWWALPVFLFSVLVSFPFTVVGCGGAWLAGVLFSGDDWAVWIEDAWRAYGGFSAAAWILGLLAVRFFRGGAFASSRARWRAIGGIVIVMVPFVTLDTFFWRLDSQWYNGTTQLVAEGVSPDGCRRVYVFRDAWLDVSYYLVGEANAVLPLRSRWLESIAFQNTPVPEEASLLWSADSQVVVLWLDNSPFVAYDFSTCRSLSLDLDLPSYAKPEPADERRQAEFDRQYARLMAVHGGPAP